MALAGLVTTGVIFGFVVVPGVAEPGPLPAVDGTIHVDLGTAVNEFPGTRALGAGVDGLEEGEIDKVWTPSNVQAMKAAGFGPISYRLRTELGVKAWHWNPRGTWSDPAAGQGYWVSSDEPREDYKASQGYRLPRRGNTIDQAKNDGYSRLTDGDPTTFWKSNPYLDSHFTGEADDLNPQWIMAAFRHAFPIDTLRFDWGTPFATGFKVQYWSGKDAHFPVDGGKWIDFPQSSHKGTGGTQTVRIAPKPMDVQYLRVVLTKDSDTAPAGSTDVRDKLGFAVRELSIGQTIDGRFDDHVTPPAVAGADGDVDLLDRPLAPRGRHRQTLRARELRAALRKRHHQRPADDGARAGTVRRARGHGRPGALSRKNAGTRWNASRSARNRTASSPSPNTTARCICRWPGR